MLTTTLLTLSLGLPPAGLAPPAPCLIEATQEDAYAALLVEYEAAAEKWKQDVRSADFETRRTLRENPPARVFKPRFDALAEKGEGRALLWLVEEARSWAGGAVKGREAQRGLYPRLLEQHMEAAWFEEVVVSLAGARRVRQPRLAAVPPRGAVGRARHVGGAETTASARSRGRRAS